MDHREVRPLFRPRPGPPGNLQQFSAAHGAAERDDLRPPLALSVDARRWFGTSPDAGLEPRAALRNPPSERYIAGLSCLASFLPPRPRQATRRPPRRRSRGSDALLWLTGCFGVLLREHVGWLADDFRPEAISRYLAHAEHAGLIGVLNAHRLHRGGGTDRGGGATAFATLTEAGYAWLEEHLPDQSVLRPFPLEKLTTRPGRAGRLMDHDQRVAGWVMAYLHRTLMPAWWVRTSATARGHLLPALEQGRAAGRKRLPRPYWDLLAGELEVGAHEMTMDPHSDHRAITLIKPDAIVATDWEACSPLADVIVEFQTDDHAGFADKLAHYDEFLAGWCFGLGRHRPIVVVISPADRRRQIMRIADQTLKTRFRYLHSPDLPGFYPGREHMLFCEEADIYRGSLRAWALPPVAPGDPGRQPSDAAREVSLVGRCR